MIDRSTPALGDLFQDIILEHYRQPRNKGSLEGATAHVHMNNPTCGDEVHLYLAVEDGVVKDVAFEGDLPRGAHPDLSVDGTIEIERLEDVLHVGRPAYGQVGVSPRR